MRNRKSIAKILVLVLVVAAAPALQAATHTFNASGTPRDFGVVTPPELPTGVPVPVLVNDGSFEAGGTCGAGTSAWAEVDSTGCTPWIGDWGPGSCFLEIFPVSAADGIQAFWAGGFCGAQNVNTATQSVTIPSDSDCVLNFWRAGIMNGDDDSVFFISMNGVDIWTQQALLANDTGGAFVADSANFCTAGFNPGDTVSLQFGVRDATLTGVGGNILFDLVEWGITAPAAEYNVPTLGGWGLAGLALLIALASFLLLRRRAA